MPVNEIVDNFDYGVSVDNAPDTGLPVPVGFQSGIPRPYPNFLFSDP